MELLLDNQIPVIDSTKDEYVNCPFLPLEIKAAVFDLPKDNTPRPDGYHASFFQKNWNLVFKDVIAMVTS